MKNKKSPLYLIAFVPAILLVLFLLNSFVLIEKGEREKATLAVQLAKVAAAKVNWNESEPVNIALKSTDGGQTWRDITQENDPGLQNAPGNFNQLNSVESEGVLIATGQKGIRRSADQGKHWQWVISEGGVGIAVEQIKGGFTAISYSTATRSRRIRISSDRGKTWQAIDEGLRPSLAISSVKQIGNYLICGHPDGIFRSSDMGKTWNKVHPGIDKNELKFLPPWSSPSSEPGKVFSLYVSGDVLYAVAGNAGC